MAYYLAGDYYRGAGDPIFGKIWGAVKGAATGFLSGGPLGAIRGGIGGAIGSGGGGARAVAPAYPVSVMSPGVPSIRPPTLIDRFRTAGQALIPGGVEPGAACPPGYHLDKRTKSKCVRNRRMNPANPRALRRAIRREAAFISLAKRTLRGSGYTFKRTGVATKRRRR